MKHTKIKTFKDACKVTGDDPKNLPDVSNLSRGMGKFILAAFKLAIIAKALNMVENGEVWIPNWNDSNQYKYEPRFYKASSGSGFSCHGYGRWNAFTCVGSRLCYGSSELAVYAGKTFIKLYNDFLSYSK